MPMMRRKYTNKRRAKTTLGNYVKRVVTSLEEKKATAAALDFTSKSPSANWQFISGLAAANISQGTAKNQRIGERIKIWKIDFVFTIIPTPGSAFMTDGTCCRFIIYHNKQANGAIPVSSQLWNTDTEAATRNITFVNRISVLKDFTHSMVATSQNAGTVLTAGPKLLTTVTIYPKAKISYQGSTGTISDILKDDYGIGYVTEAAGCCSMACNVQVHYTDD